MTDLVSDLDGVIYRGDSATPGAAEALEDLEQAGLRITFVTNNSTRTQDNVAAKIASVTGYRAQPEQIITSSQAAASMLETGDGPVLVVGELGIRAALADRGLAVTASPEEARVVIAGLCLDFSYEILAGSADAIRAGARFIATNTDPTLPVAGGLRPGSGSIVAALSTASGVEPEVAGKPHDAMRALVRERVGDDVWMIGDKVDTDMRMASREPGWQSILVLTGVTPTSQAIGVSDHVAPDFRRAVDMVLSRNRR